MDIKDKYNTKAAEVGFHARRMCCLEWLACQLVGRPFGERFSVWLFDPSCVPSRLAADACNHACMSACLPAST
eukprot:364443-Chlamydomonas_euryale.AAC.25